VSEADIDLSLKGLDRLLVGKGQRLFDDLVDQTLPVRARRVDPREDRLEKARSLGAPSGSQRQKLSWERNRASGRA
jgi:hypothetical protein